MDDFGGGCKEDAPTTGSDGCAEVDVLRVHEIALVEQADRFGVSAPNEQAGAADPVGEVLAARERVDERRRAGFAALMAAHQTLLPQLVDRTDHPAKRQLCSPFRIYEPRSDDGDIRA